MPKLGGIYIDVRARTDQYKKDLANAKNDTERAAVKIQKKIDDINWKHATAAALAFGAVMVKVSLDGFRAVEKVRLSTASLASTITSFAKDADKDLAGTYKQALAFSGDLVLKMEELNAKTVATGANLMAMVETMAQGGVVLDLNNKAQERGFIAIANALALVTQGQNADIQFRQEIRALIKGEARATDQLAKLLSQKVGGELKKNVALWKEQGTLIESVGALLSGFQEGAKDLQNTWLAVGTTLATMYDRVLRGLFTPTYTKIIDMSKALTLNILDHTDLIINSLKLLGKVSLATLPLLAVQLNAVAWSAGAAAVAMKAFYMSFLLVNAQAALLTGGLVSLKAAAGLLFAAFAGWEIGKFLHENFETARLAGLAFVDGVTKGWIHLKFAIKQGGLIIRNVWWESIEQMRLAWADFLEVVAKGASFVPGLRAISDPLKNSVRLLREGLGVGVKYAEESKKIADSKKKELEAHEKIIEVMRLEAIAYGDVTKKFSEAPAIETPAIKVDLEKELKALQDLNQKKYAMDIELAKLIQDDTWLIRQEGLEKAIQQHADTQTKITDLEYDELLKRLDAQEEFNQKFAEMGLSKFDIERMQLEELTEEYKKAGADRAKVDEWASKKGVEIARAEQNAKLDIYQDIAGGIAGTFRDISQAGGRYAKEAFVLYKASAMAQAAIAGHQAVLNALSSPLIPYPLNFIAAGVAGASAAVQVGLIASSQPPSFDSGGISNAGGVYQTGNIREAHIPIPSGKIPVDLGNGGGQGKTVQIILNNPVFQDLEAQNQKMIQIASVVTAELAPGAVVENYRNDGPVRQMVRGGA